MSFTDADFNGDGAVNSSDLNLMSPNYNTNLQTVKLLVDLDGDGDIDTNDLDLAFAQYGMELAVVS